jgi:hypothetical protein
MHFSFAVLLTLGFLLSCSLAEAAIVVQNCSSLVEASTSRSVNIVSATHIAVSQLQALFPNATTTLSTPFCRVYGQVNILDQSTVNFEVWLPDPQYYNGRFLAVGMYLFVKLSRTRANKHVTGNGGLAGVIDNSAMLLGLSQGFAIAGHVETRPSDQQRC